MEQIGDFGLSQIFSPTEKIHVPCGTMNYMSIANNSFFQFLGPELISNQGYTTKTDMWSIGVITYILYVFFSSSSRNMLCGYPPFPSDNDSLLFRMSMRGEFTFHSPAWDDISKDAKDFISALLEVDPDHRATAKQVF